MTRVNTTFHAALFAISFVICALVAFLSFNGKPGNDPEPVSYGSSPGGLVLSSQGSWPSGSDSAARAGRPQTAASTPLPDQLARNANYLPATPVAGTAMNRSRNEPAVEADYEPQGGRVAAGGGNAPDGGNPDDLFSKAMAIYATRNVAPSASADGVDLPVVTMAELDAPSPEKVIAQATTPGGSGPYVATEKATIAPSDSKSLKGMTQGYVIGREGVRAAKQAPPESKERPFEMVDISGQHNDFSSTRAEEILKKYSADDIPPSVPTAPPIAVPDELRPRAFTPTPTPGVMQRTKSLPKHLVRTPLSVLSNASGDTSGSGDGKFDFPSDAGKVPFAASFENPAQRSERRVSEHVASMAEPKPDAGTESGTFTERKMEQEAEEKAAKLPPATPGSYSVKKGKAEVSFSNVPPGWLRPQTNGPEEEAAAASPSTPASGTSATPLSNAGAAPSPTPNFDTGIDTPSVKPGKWQLPPAPTLPPKMIEPDDGKKKTPLPGVRIDGENTSIAPQVKPSPEVASLPGTSPNAQSLLEAKLADGSLPADIAQKLAGAVGGGFASVGEKTLSTDETRQRVNAALALRGNPQVSKDEREQLERRIADDWVERTAVAEEARRNKVSVTDDEVRAYQEKQKQRMGGAAFEGALKSAGFTPAEIFAEMRESALAEKYVEQIYSKTVTEAMMKSAYERDPNKFQPSRRFHVQEISRSIPSGANAQRAERDLKALLSRLKRGEDFGALAAEVSDAPSKANGGDLGWIDASTNISEDMARALVPLKPGQHSEVVKVGDTYKILKLVEMEEPKPGFEGARELMEAAARENIRVGIYETAKSNTVIKIGTYVVKPKSADDMKNRSGGSARVRPRT